MRFSVLIRVGILIIIMAALLGCCKNKADVSIPDLNPVLGRWDLTVYDPDGVYPSWLELFVNDGELAGRFVGRFGHVRPVHYVHWDGKVLTFSLPPQYEKRTDDLLFIGKIEKKHRLDGESMNENHQHIRFSGERAPDLRYQNDLKEGESIALLHDNDLDNWTVRHATSPNGWSIKGGILTNNPPSVDLVSKKEFKDFKLHIEFKFPVNANSNSGIYLRGRYELQVLDSFGQEPDSRRCGGLYGFITPTRMAVKPAGEWNSYDITLIGRRLTLVFNGEIVIDSKEIPGITGGALNSREADAGPQMLQGDHAGVIYRNIIVTPLLEK